MRGEPEPADRRWPDPFRDLIEKIDGETDPYRRTWRVIDAIEWSVKWEVAVVLGYLLDRGAIPPELRARLAAGLGRPSLGVWTELLRSVLTAAKDRPFEAWDEVLALDRAHGFIQTRNEYAHGAVERDDQANIRYARLRPVLDALSRARFLTGIGLFVRHTDGFEHRGGPAPDVATLEGLMDSTTPSWGAFAWVEETSDFIWLWPLATQLGRPEDDTLGLYFHNALRSGRIETLSYELPNQLRDVELLDRFYARAPLAEWSAEADDPNRMLVDELISGVVGREALVERLAGMVLAGAPTTVVLGVAGQGKSAVMASLARHLRARPDTVMVADVFLRRQERLSEPVHVMRSLTSRIAKALGRNAPSARTAEESAESLRTLLLAWDRQMTRTLVLIVDGVDEQPEMLEFLPGTSDRIRLVWSARPTEAVEAWVMQRRIPERDRLVVDPLDPASVRLILHRGVDKFDPRLSESYVREVARLSEGNPLFVAALSDLLFEEPERIGAVDLIPEGVEQLFQSTLDRAAKALDPRLVHETIVLLAVARDRLDDQQIAELSGSRIFEAREARRALSELLISTSPGDPRAKYGLFHDRLRQWVGDSMRAEMRSMHRRLSRLAIRPHELPSASEYLVRSGIDHLTSLPDDADRAALTRELIAELADVRTGTTWTSVLDGHALVDLFAQAHELQSTGVVDARLIGRLLDLLRDPDDGARLDPAAAHDTLAYRASRSFSDPFYLRLEDSLAEDPTVDTPLRLLAVDRRRRRATDADRATARALLSPLIDGREAEAAFEPELLARAMYQWGYLAHLEDDPQRAIMAMRRSAELASSGGDPLSALAAACVEGRFASLLGTLDDPSYLALLIEAEETFRAEQSRSPMAVRWVMNTVSQQLELATSRGDEARASELLLVLEDDPWLRSFDQLEGLSTAADRLRIAMGHGAAVLDSVERRLRDHLDVDPWREGIAELHLDVARARLAAGDASGARQAASEGLATPIGCAAWIARPGLVRLAELDGPVPDGSVRP